MVDKLDTLAERIRYLRKKSGLSLAAVAKQIGVSPQAVHKWENGGQIDRDKGMRLAELFDVLPAWLILGTQTNSDDERYLNSRLERLAEIRGHPGPSSPSMPDSGVFVPLMAHNSVPNWLSRIGHFDYHKGEWIACPAPHGENTFALHVQGVSMENLGSKLSYSDGDIIFVDPDAKCASGSRVIFIGPDMEGQDVIFRELIIEGNTSLRRPLNPLWPEQIKVVPDHEKLVGPVIGKWVPE